MNEQDIFTTYDQETGITYKHQPLFIGDVYKNEFGVLGIVLKDEDGYYYHKTNTTKHRLPDEKSGLNNSTFVANVTQDVELMNKFKELGIIKETKETKEVKEVKEDKKEVKMEETKTTKTKKTTKEEKNVSMNIYQKINAIREAWAKTDVKKEGRGRAGGGAKYDYYKPQQIIDFCLEQELKYGLFSEFTVLGENCIYTVTDVEDRTACVSVTCPFAIPKKMAASEAQQVGAAMTYHNRRLAMMMYKIEDNSRENVQVLENADYTEEKEIPIEIPAPPVMDAPTPPRAVEQAPQTPAPPAVEQNIQSEPPSVPVSESKVEEVQNIPTPPEPPITPGVAVENVQNTPIPQTSAPSIEDLY